MTRKLALLAAISLLLGIAVRAEGSHPTQICLDAEPDRAYPEAGGRIDRLTVYIGATDDDHEEPHQEECVISDEADFQNTNIDFEVTGAGDPDSTDSPDTPDLSCTVRPGSNLCEIAPPETNGDQTIAAWIDFDDEDTTVELDQEENPEDVDTDATDLVQWTWFRSGPGPCLDAEPDETINVGGDNNEDWLEVSFEPSSCAEAIGASPTVEVDFEISGDPDTDDSHSPETPDMTCTVTEPEKVCYVVPPDSGWGGHAIMAWVDLDGDNSTVEADLAEGVNEAEEPGEPEPDPTDLVLWSWTHLEMRPVPTRITIDYANGVFRGRIRSEVHRCRYRRIVWLFRKPHNGQSKKIATVEANGSRWRIADTDSVTGRFYARASSRSFDSGQGYPVNCLSDRSRGIRR